MTKSQKDVANRLCKRRQLLPYNIAIPYKDDQYWPLLRWCNANVGNMLGNDRGPGCWFHYTVSAIYPSQHVFEFKRMEDLVAFKLTWS